MFKLSSVFKFLGIGIGVLVVIVLGIASTKPDTLRVERSLTVKAPAEKIFPLINDLHSWAIWSPYEKIDPAMKKTHSGSVSGVGAIYGWEGNSDIGKGRMEILESNPFSKIGIQLDFFEPFEAHNSAEFRLEPKGEFTKITWIMSGPANYLSRIMCVFIDMDKMIGENFETGLSNLKNITEK